MATDYREVNFDGLVGPTHHYAGLAFGNEASMRHQWQTSNPRAAALQGLAKAWSVAQLGVSQAVLPPHLRPRTDWLALLGFGSANVSPIESAAGLDPHLLSAAYSASAMWTANAATVTPSCDTMDQRLHLSPANLTSGVHRSLEAEETTALFRTLFASKEFVVHPPLPNATQLRDEGAANHTRLCAGQGDPGLHLFVYGIDDRTPNELGPRKYPARQTRLASESIARRHRLPPERCLFIAQHGEAIDAGVFHNDVISVGHQDRLLCHEKAFDDSPATLQTICRRFEELTGEPLRVGLIQADALSLDAAVQSYLFNSQIVTTSENEIVMICPGECESTASAKACLENLQTSEALIDRFLFADLRQSMNNGGGPACLRLRVPMSQQERAAVHQGVWLNQERYERLGEIIEKMYPEEVSSESLSDPEFQSRAQAAWLAVMGCLDLDDFAAERIERRDDIEVSNRT